jgi:SH3 domain protein
MTKLRYLAVLLALMAHGAYAETAYVTDILRLGLHAAQDTSDQPFRTLVSGSELEVLRRLPNYAEVQTTDGRRGWVKSAYLVDEKPAQLIVAETRAELEAVRAELSIAKVARAAAEDELQRIVSDAESKVGKVVSMETTVEDLTQRNAELEARLEAYRGAVPLTWAGAATIVALVAGLLFGLWVFDAYVRHRHGGFRVY